MNHDIVIISNRFIRAGQAAAVEGEQAYLDGMSIESNPHSDDAYLSLQWRRAYVTAKYHDTSKQEN
jgi:hypothetical protein